GAFTDFLPAQSFTGGVDWDIRLKRRYAVQGYWSASSVRGSEEAMRLLQESTVHSFQRPDASHVDEDLSRTSLSGGAAMVSFQKIAGSNVRINSNVGFKSPGLEI